MTKLYDEIYHQTGLIIRLNDDVPNTIMCNFICSFTVETHCYVLAVSGKLNSTHYKMDTDMILLIPVIYRNCHITHREKFHEKYNTFLA